jgi:hypothetical protein
MNRNASNERRHAIVIGGSIAGLLAARVLSEHYEQVPLLPPDIIRAVGLLSVPYLAELWSGPPPTVAMKALLACGQMHYQLYFQEPGNADQELAQDPRSLFLRLFVGASGGIPQEKRWRRLFSPDESFLEPSHGGRAAMLDVFVTPRGSA